MRERVMRDERGDMTKLRRLRFQKIAARGYAVKKIGHADRRSKRKSLRLYADQLSARKFNARALGIFLCARLQQQARDGRDGRQGFAAKTQRGNRKQIVRVAQFRRGVPLKGQQRIVVNHSAAIVNHANHAFAAGFDFHANRLRSSVERVFEQLFYDGRGPLDDFAGGDFVRNVLRKYAYSRHVSVNCSANLQVGIRESKPCPPKGGRYITNYFSSLGFS